jgi:hypothetical protein
MGNESYESPPQLKAYYILFTYKAGGFSDVCGTTVLKSLNLENLFKSIEKFKKQFRDFEIQSITFVG